MDSDTNPTVTAEETSQYFSGAAGILRKHRTAFWETAKRSEIKRESAPSVSDDG